MEPDYARRYHPHHRLWRFRPVRRGDEGRDSDAPPGAAIIDLTHRIAPFHAGEAGFWLSRTYRYFPTDSIHVAVVDPGVGTPRRILAAAHDGHRFLAPDNGILPMIIGQRAELHSLSPDWLARQNWPAPSHTFHGRDIFAPLAAAMFNREVAPADIGAVETSPVPAAIAAPVVVNDTVRGQVVTVDTWGNLITNIDAGLISGLRNPRVSLASRDLHLATTYGAAAPGALLALVNSFGVIEVASREGNAARILRVGHGAPVTVTDSS